MVGLGIGQQHLRHWQTLTDRFEIALVCDSDSTRLAKARQRLGCDGVSDIAAVLKAGVDIIDICTPPQLHFEMASQSLRTGHHTVCEKPLVSSLQECDALIYLQARGDPLLMPISQYRFAPGVQRLKYLLEVGLIGEPYLSSIETHWHRDASYYREPWRGRWATEGGGQVLIVVYADAGSALFYLVPQERVPQEPVAGSAELLREVARLNSSDELRNRFHTLDGGVVHYDVDADSNTWVIASVIEATTPAGRGEGRRFEHNFDYWPLL